jgi:hypothetical protein
MLSQRKSSVVSLSCIFEKEYSVKKDREKIKGKEDRKSMKALSPPACGITLSS